MPESARTATAKIQHLGRDLGEGLLSVQEVAKLLGLSARTVRRLAARGSLPCYRIGRLVRFALGDVFRWLEARKEA